jgi:hypothetical protein
MVARMEGVRSDKRCAMAITTWMEQHPSDFQPIMMFYDRGVRVSDYECPTPPEGASRLFDD